MADDSRRTRYVADPGLREVFSDTISSVGFDGANMRLELSVSRVGQGGGERETTVHPAARLVLPLNAVNELMQKVGAALSDLEKQGVLRKSSPPEKPKGPQRN